MDMAIISTPPHPLSRVAQSVVTCGTPMTDGAS
jgi:hypothetical protein